MRAAEADIAGGCFSLCLLAAASAAALISASFIAASFFITAPGTGFDSLILALGLLAVSPEQVALSVLGAAALNLVIGVNHRPDRYHGF